MRSNACNRHQQDMDRELCFVKAFAKTLSTIINKLINVCHLSNVTYTAKLPSRKKLLIHQIFIFGNNLVLFSCSQIFLKK
jgi:hypothetical protein